MGILGLLGLPLCCYVGSVLFVLSVLFVVFVLFVLSVLFSARAALAPRGYAALASHLSARIAGSAPAAVPPKKYLFNTLVGA